MSAEVAYIKETILKYLERFEADKVAELEKSLSASDKVSLIYLLYDDPEVAVDCLTLRFRSNIVTEWCEDLSKKKRGEWKLRVVESLALMQNFKCLKHLGYNKRDLGEVSRILDKAVRSKEFDIRKTLYSTFDSLSVSELSKVINSMDGKKANSGRPDIYSPEHIEMYLLEWQIQGRITLNRQGLNHILCTLKSLNLTLGVNTLESRMDNLEKQGWNDLQPPDEKTIERCHSPSPVEEDSSDYYPITNAENVGICIIVNQENYLKGSKHKPRRGSQYDVERLEKTMTRLKIDTLVLSNLTHDQIFPHIESTVRQNFKPNLHSILFVVIMAHGTEEVIVGIDGVSVKRDKIRDSLSWEVCPTLINKPKIIIFQCCRGDYHCDLLESDSPDGLDIPDGLDSPNSVDSPDVVDSCLVRSSMDDYIICWSTIPGFKSYRSPQEGSLYIQTLCECLDTSKPNDDIYSILHRVSREFKDRRVPFYPGINFSMIPEFSSGLRKKLFLYQQSSY